MKLKHFDQNEDLTGNFSICIFEVILTKKLKPNVWFEPLLKVASNLGLNFASEGYVCVVPTYMAQIYELKFHNILGVVSQVGLSFSLLE